MPLSNISIKTIIAGNSKYASHQKNRVHNTYATVDNKSLPTVLKYGFFAPYNP